MIEDWEEIAEFPDYAVSNFGDVINMRFGGTPVRPSPNQYGVVRVGLVKDRRQYTRALALLVATAFVPVPNDNPIFDTPIHLDGDQFNCKAENLMWRPRWFAIKYHKQFRSDAFLTSRPVHIYDILTETHYSSTREACIANGLYWFDVQQSYIEGRTTFPTGQSFRLIEN